MTVVCNTSPISNLAAIGQLSILQQVYDDITIPQAVADEIAKVATIYAQAALIPSQPWITVKSISDVLTMQRLRGRKLDAGEAEAIALALELGAELLVIDEQLGRQIAINEGLNITGLVGTLLEAKSRKQISQVKPMMDDLIVQARFRISSQLYAEVLHLAGEGDIAFPSLLRYSNSNG